MAPKHQILPKCHFQNQSEIMKCDLILLKIKQVLNWTIFNELSLFQINQLKMEDVVKSQKGFKIPKTSQNAALKIKVKLLNMI